jgi:hypothetical protein
VNSIRDYRDPCQCGKRRGLHRYGNEACPNPAWRVGNGEPHWLMTRYKRAPDPNTLFSANWLPRNPELTEAER